MRDCLKGVVHLILKIISPYNVLMVDQHTKFQHGGIMITLLNLIKSAFLFYDKTCITGTKYSCKQQHGAKPQIIIFSYKHKDSIQKTGFILTLSFNMTAL